MDKNMPDGDFPSTPSSDGTLSLDDISDFATGAMTPDTMVPPDGDDG
jgi:hypothetical protein